MMRTLALCVTILSACVLVGFDDDVPWLDFPDDVRYRRYKIGNVVSGKDPQDLDAVIEAIEIVEGLSRGGRRDRAVISVPAWLNWDGVVPQGEVEFVQAIRIVTNNEVDVHFVVDPLPNRTYLGGQDPMPPGTSFGDLAVRQAFADYVIDVIVRIDPEYITLGAEVNMFYHVTGGADFGNLNSLINATADIVRALSPDTKILTTFQWEHLHYFISSGGWEPIENYAWNIDILGISSFPMTYLQYWDPSRLPWWYYSQIYLHFPPNHTSDTLGLAISEIGFPSQEEYHTDGSEKHQNNGIVTMIELVDQFMSLEFINYWYLHDFDEYFRQLSYGLIESTTTVGGVPGRIKPAYSMWEELGDLRYRP